MYRIFCESYNNFINAFPVKMVGLTDDVIDKKLSDLIFYMQENIERFPKLKAFLWTLSSRNIIGKKYNVSNKEELEEQTKLVNSFLKLAYWY